MDHVKDVRVLCERGFTLIELMISIVISSVIVAAGYTVSDHDTQGHDLE